MLNASGRGGSTGSGSMIDPRGYVLTNFHVVGIMRPEDGIPGTLRNPRNRVQLATVESARQSARPRWVGAVVRGDAVLDLALIRILGDAEGRPPSAPFPTVPLAGTGELRPGARVWAFGFPLGVRTINVTGGAVAGFQMNARDEVAWLRSDAEFNPGNSGGMLVDGRGRLVAVPTRVFGAGGQGALEPVELARPVERIPAEWLRALRAGPIEDVRLTGVPEVTRAPVRALAAGDEGGMSNRDQQFFIVSPDAPRPARIVTRPALPVALMHGDGVIRAGEGSVQLRPEDPPRPSISVLIPGAGERAVAFEVSIEPLAEEAPATAAAPEGFGFRAGTLAPSPPRPSPPAAPAGGAPPDPFASAPPAATVQPPRSPPATPASPPPLPSLPPSARSS